MSKRHPDARLGYRFFKWLFETCGMTEPMFYGLWSADQEEFLDDYSNHLKVKEAIKLAEEYEKTHKQTTE